VLSPVLASACSAATLHPNASGDWYAWYAEYRLAGDKQYPADELLTIVKHRFIISSTASSVSQRENQEMGKTIDVYGKEMLISLMGFRCLHRQWPSGQSQE
jgi:hypothetical protein